MWVSFVWLSLTTANRSFLALVVRKLSCHIQHPGTSNPVEQKLYFSSFPFMLTEPNKK